MLKQARIVLDPERLERRHRAPLHSSICSGRYGTAGQTRIRPVSVIEVNVGSSMVNDQAELVMPSNGHADFLRGAGPAHQTTVVQLHTIAKNLEIDRPSGSHLIVCSNVGLESVTVVADIIKNLRVCVRTNPFRVSHPVQSYNIAEYAGVQMDRPPSNTF